VNWHVEFITEFYNRMNVKCLRFKKMKNLSEKFMPTCYIESV